MTTVTVCSLYRFLSDSDRATFSPYNLSKTRTINSLKRNASYRRTTCSCLTAFNISNSRRLSSELYTDILATRLAFEPSFDWTLRTNENRPLQQSSQTLIIVFYCRCIKWFYIAYTFTRWQAWSSRDFSLGLVKTSRYWNLKVLVLVLNYTKMGMQRSLAC